MSKKRNLSAAQKVAIVREHLIEKCYGPNCRRTSIGKLRFGGLNELSRVTPAVP